MLDGADIAFVWGDPADGKFAALYGWQGRVVGALGWNAPRELSQLRQHVVDKTAWTWLWPRTPADLRSRTTNGRRRG